MNKVALQGPDNLWNVSNTRIMKPLLKISGWYVVGGGDERQTLETTGKWEQKGTGDGVSALSLQK